DERHRLYARLDWHGHITVRQVETDEEIALLEGPPGDNWVHFSPDGRFLVLDGMGQQRTWDLATSPPALLIEEQSGASGQTFHPDGQHMVLTRNDGSILLYDLTSAHQPPRLLAKFRDGGVIWPALDPLGKKLAVVKADGRSVHILDAKSAKPLSTPWLLKARISNPVVWHPAGKLLAAACEDSRIYLWDMTRGQQAAVMEGCRNSGISVTFTPDGEFLVSTGWESK